MNISKPRIFIAVLIVFGLITYHYIDSKKQASFRYVFMTDIHVMWDKNAADGLATAVDHINNLKPRPDFVITGGDLIFDALNQSQARADSLYDLYQSLTAKLEMPIYNCIGNHDHFGVYTSSGIDENNPLYSTAMFEKRMNIDKPYYSFDHNNWHFIMMNSISITPDRRYTGHFDEKQLNWLKDDLEKCGKDKQIVITTHIPLYSAATFFRDSSLAANRPGLVVDNSDKVFKICKPYQLNTVLQGHLHIVEDIGWRDTRFITGGAVCGSWWDGSYYGFPEGFVVVDVEGNNFYWKYETYGWKAAKNRH